MLRPSGASESSSALSCSWPHSTSRRGAIARLRAHQRGRWTSARSARRRPPRLFRARRRLRRSFDDSSSEQIRWRAGIPIGRGTPATPRCKRLDRKIGPAGTVGGWLGEEEGAKPIGDREPRIERGDQFEQRVQQVVVLIGRSRQPLPPEIHHGANPVEIGEQAVEPERRDA